MASVPRGRNHRLCRSLHFPNLILLLLLLCLMGFSCSVPGCSKNYETQGGLKAHRKSCKPYHDFVARSVLESSSGSGTQSPPPRRKRGRDTKKITILQALSEKNALRVQRCLFSCFIFEAGVLITPLVSSLACAFIVNRSQTSICPDLVPRYIEVCY
jgi:hypothetical protein